MIRKYSHKDKPKVIELLRLNIPMFFAPSEENDFDYYLENSIEDYFIYEKNFDIIGAGGINYLTKSKTARLSWDIIHPQFHGKGIGKKLALHRITYLEERGDVEQIVVRTSQMAYKFYEKMGFVLVRIEKDFWANGYDLFLMKMS